MRLNLPVLMMVLTAGCSTTRYLGPMDAVTPIGRNYPPNVPRVVSVTGTTAVLQYPGGGTQTMATDSIYIQPETNYGLGALEGFLGGVMVGGLTAAAASSSCAHDDCTAAVVVLPLLMGAVGALYGVFVGHKTTYVLGGIP